MDLEKLNSDIQPLRERSEAAREAYEAAELALSDAETAFNARLPQLKESVEIASKNKELADRSRGLEEQHSHLHDGDTCPLCGNVYHTNVLFSLFDGMEEALQVAKRALSDEEANVGAVRGRRDAARREYDALNRSLETESARLSDLKSQCSADLAGAKSEVDSAARNLAEAGSRLEAAEREVEKADASEKSARAECAAAKKVFEELGVPDPAARTDEVLNVFSKAENEKRKAEEILNRLNDALNSAEEECRAAESARLNAETELRTAEDVFGGKLAAAGFTDEETWGESCWDGEGFNEARNERDALHDENAALKNRRTALEAGQAAHDASVDATPRSEEEVVDEKRTVDARRDEINRNLGSIRSELDADDANRKHLGSLRQELLAAKEEASIWKTLDGFFGGTDGFRFRNYANGFTFRRLLDRANPHLLLMSGGRYSMKWDAPEKIVCRSDRFGLLPEIIDAESGGAERTVRNLSGGEIFQVSLSLALGLSEMTRGSERMENLFLDEGFGTLEGEPLERAIDTLEHVQGAGCLLGVISHIAAVADRIRTQIVASKDGFGHSSLSGPGVARIAPAAVAGRRSRGNGGA